MSPLPDMTRDQFVALAAKIAELPEDAVLVKNEVGNLAVYTSDAYIGWVDLRLGLLNLFTDDGD